MGITVFLMSLVKNLGFSFPSTDLAVGVKLELSRLFYGAGLVAAGIISERNRKYGAICTMAALAIPFVMLTITDEPVPRFISWSLDYLFYGFFSVFRVVLFLDVAGRTRQYYLAPLGLAMGRIGDAAGTAFCIGLTGHRIILVAFTTLLFMLTIFFFFRLLHVVYEPAKEHVRSEREIFEAFAIQHDLSMREKEVLRLLLSERSNAEIAGALFVSESTVKYHVHNILQKTGCKSRQDLVKQYTISLFPRLQSS
ncbi:MAG: helix-turn-helix transcriptional regulator [Clostridia bacterium]|nr:helix-turn-helix transcriptional regulator [Clostridia bacterium]